jgi:hypothetical protein
MGATSKTLLVYTPDHHENTAQVAHAMAGVLGAECTSPAECLYSRRSGYKLTSSPVFVPVLMRELGRGTRFYHQGGRRPCPVAEA